MAAGAAIFGMSRNEGGGDPGGVFDMNILNKPEFLLAFSMAPFCGYVSLYLALRLCGTLCVSARGWHAGSVHVGRRMVLSAPRLFGFFQAPLRLESRVTRWLSRLRDKPAEQGISEVVVEVIPLA